MESVVTLDSIRSAATAIAGDLVPTCVTRAARIEELCGTPLYLKLESQHPTGSFKERGALAKLKSLSSKEAEAGVIAMSAGNHAQAVAHHATKLGIRATVVMPEMTPFTKIDRTAQLGARVLVKGASLSEAHTYAQELARSDGLTFIHPYDDPQIIAGQGTIALEFLAAVPRLDILVVPIGGGGLISGIAIAAKAMNRSIEVIGVEAALYPSMHQCLAGTPIACSGVTLAEGIAVKAPGQLTREIIRNTVDDIVLVSEAQLERAVYELATRQKLVAEGAGAAGVAAILAEPDRFKGRTIGSIICGGNIDDRLLAQILMRGLVRDGRIARLRIGLTDVPGALAGITTAIGDSGGNIVEVYHQRLFHDVPVKMAEIEVVLESRDRRHLDEILSALDAAGFQAVVLPDTIGTDTPVHHA